MNTALSVHQQIKKYPDFPNAQKINVVQTKRQRVLANVLLNKRFTPKHYPCIFLDQRLRSRFFS